MNARIKWRRAVNERERKIERERDGKRASARGIAPTIRQNYNKMYVLYAHALTAMGNWQDDWPKVNWTFISVLPTFADDMNDASGCECATPMHTAFMNVAGWWVICSAWHGTSRRVANRVRSHALEQFPSIGLLLLLDIRENLEFFLMLSQFFLLKIYKSLNFSVKSHFVATMTAP